MEKRKRGRPEGSFKYAIDNKPVDIQTWKRWIIKQDSPEAEKYKAKLRYQRAGVWETYIPKHKEQKRAVEKVRTYNIDYKGYKQKTSICALCGFSKYAVDLHHIDKNKANNKENNLIGLCPNCHLGIHRNHFNINEDYLKRLVYIQKQNNLFEAFCYVLN
jgi:hypothetical protein